MKLISRYSPLFIFSSTFKLRDIDSVTIPRKKLLKMSSENFEDFSQQISKKRSLSHEEERQMKHQRRYLIHFSANRSNNKQRKNNTPFPILSLQRLVKNREYAELSRQRNRAYILQKTRKLDEVVDENQTLTK